MLTAVALADDLPSACRAARQLAESVCFEGKVFRSDIGHGALGREASTGGWTYARAGVDVAAGGALVERLRPLAAATSRAGCQAELGGFGGIFDLRAAGFRDPLLVSGTDGVGTKLKVSDGGAAVVQAGTELSG